MASKGELRIRCGVDSVGDYYAKVEIYQGFMKGWKGLKTYWSVSLRTPTEALECARRWKAENDGITLGVVK